MFEPGGIEPRRGAVVRSFDPADLVDLYEVRALLEARAAGLAAARIAPADLALLEATCERVEGLTGNSARTIDTLIANGRSCFSLRARLIRLGCSRLFCDPDGPFSIVDIQANSPKFTGSFRCALGVGCLNP